MQGLSKYADSPSPEVPTAGPSGLDERSPRRDEHHRSRSRDRHERRRSRDGDRERRRRSIDEDRSRSQTPERKRRRTASPTPEAAGPSGTTSRDRSRSRSASSSPDPFAGLDPDVVFRTVTQPAPMPEADWGLPPAVDPEQADEALKAKVARFLQLKSQGQHVNTSLLKSSAFANPTIYAKLVEFVDIDERASAFPRGGWITRRGLEDTRPQYGPKALQRRQDELADAARRAQRDRRGIEFTSAKTRDRRERDDRDRGGRDRRERDRRDRDRREDRGGGLSRPRQQGWMARR